MTLGAWIFLSVVLVLVVLNKPFRKFFLWAAAISAVCVGVFFGYERIRDWRERREQAREAAIQQKKQDDCNARLNAVNSSDAMERVFQQLSNADLCRENPDITAEEATAAAKTPPRTSPVQKPPDTLPADFFDKQDASRPTAIEGTVAKDSILYGESTAAGPGGKALAKVASGAKVRVIRLDSLYGNVLIRTAQGFTGWVSMSDVSY